MFGLFKKKPERYKIYEISPEGEKEVIYDSKNKPVKEQIIPQPEYSYICVPVYSDGNEGEAVWSFREKADKTDELIARLAEKFQEPKKKKKKGLINEERLEEITSFADDIKRMADTLRTIQESFSMGSDKPSSSGIELGKLEFDGKVPAIMHPALIQTYSGVFESMARNVGKALREELVGDIPTSKSKKKVVSPKKAKVDAVKELEEVLKE